MSNFWPVEIVGPGQLVYPSVEHAYVAAKSENSKDWFVIRDLSTSGKAKRYGKSIKLRGDWDSIKLILMTNYVNQKFRNDPLLAMLKETAPHELVEGNTWGDTYWGQCPIGNGANHLGKILMRIRDDESLDRFISL